MFVLVSRDVVCKHPNRHDFDLHCNKRKLLRIGKFYFKVQTEPIPLGD